MKRMNDNGPASKTRDLGGGQTLTSYNGKDSSDVRTVSDTKLGGGMNNLSDTLPRDRKVNDD